MNLTANSDISQELLTSTKKPKPEQTPSAEDGKKSRRFNFSNLAFLFLYFFLAIGAFIVFLVPKLPYQDLAQSALNLLSDSTPFVWKSESVKTSFIFGPKIEFQKLTLTGKPSGLASPSDANQIKIDSFSLRPGILSAGFKLEAFQGKSSGSLGFSFAQSPNKSFGAPANFTAKITNLVNQYTLGLNQINILAEKINLEKVATSLKMQELDIKGSIDKFAVDLQTADGHFSASNGTFNVMLKGLGLDPAGFNTGMPLPILVLGDAKINAIVTNGRINIRQGLIGGPASDAEIMIDGTITIREPVEVSEMDLILRVKFAPKIIQAIPMIDTFFAAGKRPDGYYGLKLNGSLAYPGMPTPYAGN
jgi:type II secretion system protein N